jgi:pimeloyl-ACP methyl ester carboxylesterase
MRSMLSQALGLLAVAIAVLIALGALLWVRQESFIFFPRPNDPMLLLRHQANRVVIQGPEGALEGWWAPNLKATNDLVILYFGGNAEDVLYTAMTAPLFHAERMLVVNYRGYGRSSGKPGQKALYEDALAIHRYVVAECGVEPERIVVMGRSLGAAVATMLAAERPVRAAVLVTPFGALTDVAAHHYPLLPVRLLLRHRFPAVSFGRRAQSPAILLAAERDTVVPAAHARRLSEAWAAEKELYLLDGVGHNDIELHTDYYRLINAFLDRMAAGRRM